MRAGWTFYDWAHRFSSVSVFVPVAQSPCMRVFHHHQSQVLALVHFMLRMFPIRGHI